jgi:thiol-disulfide isomerase/thioredoxin
VGASAVGSTPVIGSIVPDFVWQRPTQEAVHLVSLRGRPVVINVWATWCIPCRTEMPRVELTARAHPDVMFVALNGGESDGVVWDFVSRLEVRAVEPVIDPTAKLARLLAGSSAVPTTLFLNHEGRLVSRVIGEISAEELEQRLHDVRPGREADRTRGRPWGDLAATTSRY